jgi:CheY-like chemotaxis protein
MPARIVVIDDNLANLDLMIYLLEAFGHMPIKATDGLSGYEAVKTEIPDLVITDLRMPRMDGFELARLLKADPASSEVPLIAVTASAMVGDQERVLNAGFDGYITKPIDPHHFVEQIDEFLPADLRSDRKSTGDER